MVREDIFEGLKCGLARGKTLQETMQSFYNSGYSKKEIDEAAKLLLANKAKGIMSPQPALPGQQPTAQPNYQPQTVLSQEEIQKQKQQIKTPGKSDQLVSYYDTSPQKPKKSKGMGLIILLIILLFALFGALIAVFIFRENIIGFFQ